MYVKNDETTDINTLTKSALKQHSVNKLCEFICLCSFIQISMHVFNFNIDQRIQAVIGDDTR